MIPLLAAALAADPAALAPTPADLTAAVAALELRLAEAEAVGEAAARVQNRWIEDPAVTGARPTRAPCKEPADAALAANAGAWTSAYRDATQSARAALDRVEPMWTAPTVRPLLGEEDRSRAAELRAAVERHTATWLELAAWHDRVIAPTVRRCPALPSPAPGVPRAEIPAEDDLSPGVAVIALGGGLLCPGAVPADGRAVVLADGLACVAATTCDCVPAAQSPGAVLGR